MQKRMWMLVMVLLFCTGSVFAQKRYTRVETSTLVASREITVEVPVPATPQPRATLEGARIALAEKGPVALFGLLPDLVEPAEVPEPTVNLEKKIVGETPEEVAKRIVPAGMPERDRWFVVEEIKFLNRTRVKLDAEGRYPVGAKLVVPEYHYYEGRSSVRSDMRNIHVAVIYGRLRGVHWAYMVGVRYQENPDPRRDHYAYGVVCRKGTNLRSQAEKAAEILARYTRNSTRPSQSDMYRCALTYVGTGSASAAHWSSCVYSFYRAAQPQPAH